jgi:hypothetical protein
MSIYSPRRCIQTAEVQLQSFLKPELGTGLVVNSKPRFKPRERIRIPEPIIKEAVWAPELFSTIFGENILPIPDFGPQTIEPVAIHCTD